MKNRLVLWLIVIFPALLPAQEEWLNSALEESLGYDAHNKKEWYKGQVLKKERTGMGILKMKDGKIYIGDLSKGKMNGTGMMLSPMGDKISNCKECAIYVGNWKQGIKSGKGTCYNKAGDVIYSGNFQNDAPVETYPSQEENLLNYFSFIECDNEELYLGEIKEGELNGYGVLRWENGDIWFGTMKDGKRKGIGLYLMNNGEWVTVNCNEDEYEPISSSIDYKNTAASMKAAKNQSFSFVMSNFAAAAMTSVEVSKGIKDIKANNPSISNVGSSIDTGTTSGNKSSTNTSSSNKSKIADCGSNWRSDSRVYSNYESQLIKMRTYPEKPANYTADYTDIQTKMRQIRLKWEARGCLITKSQYE